MLTGRQIKPSRLPLEPFFQKGYARLARVWSRLIVEHSQHFWILLNLIHEICAQSDEIGFNIENLVSGAINRQVRLAADSLQKIRDPGFNSYGPES